MKSITSKMSLQPELAAAKLNQMCADVKAGRITAESLKTGARLSKALIVEAVRPYGLHSDSSLLSEPITHMAYRALKFAVEGITRAPEEIPFSHAGLVSDIQTLLQARPHIKTVSQIWRADPDLYRRVRSDPHSTLIFWAGGIHRGRRELLYWTDEQLLEAACDYDSLSQLKYEGGELHRHLAGRGLFQALLKRNPRLFNHFRVGHGGYRYRSLPELILGNWLEFNSIAVRREVNTGVRVARSQRSLVADFMFDEPGLIVELLQSDGPGRGSRGAAYAKRWQSKQEAYSRHGIRFLPINTDDLFDHGVLRVDAFVSRVRCELAAWGIDLGPVPDLPLLLHEDLSAKNALLTLDTHQVIQYLRGLGARTTAVLRNRFSWALTCLQVRSDYQLILDAFLLAGKLARSRAIAATRAKARLRYASLQEIRELCEAHGISSQVQWQRFAKQHRAWLKSRGVPANLPYVYRKVGTWTRWGDLWAKRPTA